MALPKMTQSELASELAEVTGTSRADAKRTLEALAEIVQDNIKNCVRTEIASVVIEPKYRGATKKRKGRNPQTGEEVTIAAKPASVVVKARVGAKLKTYAPSVKKLQSAL